MFRKHFEDYLASYRRNNKNFCERYAYVVGKMTYAFVPMYVLFHQNHLSTTIITIGLRATFDILSSKRCHTYGLLVVFSSDLLYTEYVWCSSRYKYCTFLIQNWMLTWLLPIQSKRTINITSMWHINNAFKVSTGRACGFCVCFLVFGCH